MSKSILGYTDELSVAPGESIRFMVSCDPSVARYEAGIVRMICGDAQPGAPGLKQQPVATTVDGTYAARHQPIHAGSFAWVADSQAFADLDSLTVRATIQPTRSGLAQQTIMSKFDAASGQGFELFLDASDCLVLRLGDAVVCGTCPPLRHRAWCSVAATFDRCSSVVRFVQGQHADGLATSRRDVSEVPVGASPTLRTTVPLMIGASYRGGDDRPWARPASTAASSTPL